MKSGIQGLPALTGHRFEDWVNVEDTPCLKKSHHIDKWSEGRIINRRSSEVSRRDSPDYNSLGCCGLQGTPSPLLPQTIIWVSVESENTWSRKYLVMSERIDVRLQCRVFVWRCLRKFSGRKRGSEFSGERRTRHRKTYKSLWESGYS